MHDLLYPALAAIAWVATGYRWVVAVRRGAASPARHAVTAAIGLLALTFTMSTPAVWTFLDRVTGITNVAALLAHLCVVGFSTTVQVMLVWWANPPVAAQRKARHRYLFLAGVAGVLLVLFVLADPTESHPSDFVATYAGRPLFAVYLVAYLGAFAAGLLDIIRICWPYARLVGRGSLRVGLRTTAAGAALGLVYCGLRALDIVGVAVGWDVRRWEAAVPITSSLGALLVIFGLTVPAWVPRVSAAADLPRRVRLVRDLRPLWMELTDAVPEVRLADTAAGRPWRPGRQLHRQVIEIYDARLALRPYIDDAVADEARRRGEAGGLSGDELAAVIEAAKLRAALVAARADARPDRPEPPGPPIADVDETREVEQLARVARAFAQIPRAARSV